MVGISALGEEAHPLPKQLGEGIGGTNPTTHIHTMPFVLMLSFFPRQGQNWMKTLVRNQLDP